MIVFLLTIGGGIDTDSASARTSIQQWLNRHPMFPDKSVHSWTSTDGAVSCHWGGHRPDEVGGVRYTAESADAFALFCGRPINWRDGEADGLSAIDARNYLATPNTWSSQLDGRYSVTRVDDRDIHVQTDAGLPVYVSRRDGVTFISNMAKLVTPPGARPRARAMAAFIAGGWSMTGEPLREGVDRLAPGTLHHFDREGSATTRRHQPSYADILRTRPDYPEAARMFVSLARGFASWPGRPLVFGLTGGKDSRLVAAALRHADLKPETLTFAFAGQVGYPETGDVRLARHLATTLGWSHTVVPTTPESPIYARIPEIIGILELVSPQTTSLTDYMDTTELEPAIPPRILFDGVGGEIGRGAWAAYLGGEPPRGDSVDKVTDAVLTKVIPTSPAPLVNVDGMALVREWTREFVQTEVDNGVSLDDIHEVLHVERLSHWHGPNLTNRSHREDAVSMFLSPRMWPHMVGHNEHGRRSGEFRRELLNILGPDLAELPYEDGKSTWLYDSELAKTLNSGTRKQTYEIPVEPIGAILEAAKTAASNHSDHPAWSVLNRDRVSELLSYPPDRFRGIERYQLWTLATAFCTPPGEDQ